MNSVERGEGNRPGEPAIVVLTRLAIDPASDSDLRQLAIGEEPRFLDEGWLTERIWQMEQLSLLSLERQIHKPDLHLIGVDERVFERSRDMLSGRLPGFSELLKLGVRDAFNEKVRERLSGLATDVVSVRLDSDDSLAPRFLRMVVKRIRAGEALNFPHGIQWLASDGYVVHRWILSNPTIAYRSIRQEHVFDFGRHRLVREKVRTVNWWTVSPMFLKFSHPLSHASHQTGGWSLLFPRRAILKFGINESIAFRPVRWNPLALGGLALFYFRRKLPGVDRKLYRVLRRWKKFHTNEI